MDHDNQFRGGDVWRQRAFLMTSSTSE
jgi:hypothetical protein